VFAKWNKNGEDEEKEISLKEVEEGVDY